MRAARIGHILGLLWGQNELVKHLEQDGISINYSPLLSSSLSILLSLKMGRFEGNSQVLWDGRTKGSFPLVLFQQHSLQSWLLGPRSAALLLLSYIFLLCLPPPQQGSSQLESFETTQDLKTYSVGGSAWRQIFRRRKRSLIHIHVDHLWGWQPERQSPCPPSPLTGGWNRVM